MSRAPKDVDILTVLGHLVLADVLVFAMAFILGKQRSRGKTRNLRTGTRNFEIQDGEDVDLLRRPDNEYLFKKQANQVLYISDFFEKSC